MKVYTVLKKGMQCSHICGIFDSLKLALDHGIERSNMEPGEWRHFIISEITLNQPLKLENWSCDSDFNYEETCLYKITFDNGEANIDKMEPNNR